jgi:hypothetical protein
VDHRVPAHIETCFTTVIEHMYLCRVADAVERAIERHSVVHAQLPSLLLGDGHLEVVVGHAQNP